jgi:RNA-directed DNA polymerase
MKESHGEGLATHSGPESCGAVRKESVEALTGVGAGRVFSRERISLRDADAVGVSGRPNRAHRYREMRPGPARSETPCTYGNISHENREVLCSPAVDGIAGRVGKSKDIRRRWTSTGSRTVP